MSKKRTASEVTIRLGDWLIGIPRNLDKAIQVTLQIWRDMDDPEEWNTDRLRDTAKSYYWNIFASLMNEALKQDRAPGAGPKGPRLPKGLQLIHLLPHLVIAQRVLAEKKIPFEEWVREHPWPGGMKVKSNTLRNWLTRYAKHIARYDAQTQAIKGPNPTSPN